jgi:hypothetical protein
VGVVVVVVVMGGGESRGKRDAFHVAFFGVAGYISKYGKNYCQSQNLKDGARPVVIAMAINISYHV